jgi:hypothetical protein
MDELTSRSEREIASWSIEDVMEGRKSLEWTFTFYQLQMTISSRILSLAFIHPSSLRNRVNGLILWGRRARKVGQQQAGGVFL